jgi:hypothetical protein
MTATTAARHGCMPARVHAELTWRLSLHTWRLSWDAGQLAAHQRERLRMLLAYAAEYSPFHARRLRGLDLSRFEVGDLAGLPVMTKSQMMAEFDDVVTGGHLATTSLAARLEHALRLAGLTEPHVSIRSAETITRDPDTGKVSRFIPRREVLAQPGMPAPEGP